MNTLLDNMNDTSTVSITRVKYDSLLIANKERNDLFDLITSRVNAKENLSYEDLKVIYEMQIKPPNSWYAATLEEIEEGK